MPQQAIPRRTQLKPSQEKPKTAEKGGSWGCHQEYWRMLSIPEMCHILLTWFFVMFGPAWLWKDIGTSASTSYQYITKNYPPVSKGESEIPMAAVDSATEYMKGFKDADLNRHSDENWWRRSALLPRQNLCSLKTWFVCWLRFGGWSCHAYHRKMCSKLLESKRPTGRSWRKTV